MELVVAAALLCSPAAPVETMNVSRGKAEALRGSSLWAAVAPNEKAFACPPGCRV